MWAFVHKKNAELTHSPLSGQRIARLNYCFYMKSILRFKVLLTSYRLGDSGRYLRRLDWQVYTKEWPDKRSPSRRHFGRAVDTCRSIVVYVSSDCIIVSCEQMHKRRCNMSWSKLHDISFSYLVSCLKEHKPCPYILNTTQTWFYQYIFNKMIHIPYLANKIDNIIPCNPNEAVALWCV